MTPSQRTALASFISALAGLAAGLAAPEEPPPQVECPPVVECAPPVLCDYPLAPVVPVPAGG